MLNSQVVVHQTKERGQKLGMKKYPHSSLLIFANMNVLISRMSSRFPLLFEWPSFLSLCHILTEYCMIFTCLIHAKLLENLFIRRYITLFRLFVFQIVKLVFFCEKLFKMSQVNLDFFLFYFKVLYIFLYMVKIYKIQEDIYKIQEDKYRSYIGCSEITCFFLNQRRCP